MSTTITITGKALVRFLFDYIPSWNEAIGQMNRHRYKGHSLTKHYRAMGETLALDFMTKCHAHRAFLIEKRAFVWVRVFRGTERVYDIHNVWAKAIFDGFADARIWKNDEWASVPHVMFSWMPPDEMGQRFEIEVHELARVEVNGQALTLPSGRTPRPRGQSKKSSK